MPLCSVPGANLFYAERGQGEPVLFLNGLGGDHLYWLGQLRAFGKQYHCLAIDHRDVGQSSYANEPYTIPALAGDLAALATKLQWPPIHVVGLSMGGMIAQELALANPELVRSLVLVNTLARVDDWFQATLSAFQKIRLQVPDTASFFEAVLPWWVGYQFFGESGRITWLRWLLHQNPHDQKLEGFLRQIEAIGLHDAIDRLPRLRCPVLILAGEDDLIAPRRFSLELHQRISHSELIMVPRVGHALPIEDPGQFNRLLSTFLQAVSAPHRRSA